MAIHYGQECNGCAECTHCGRRFKTYVIYECDRCKAESQDEDFLETFHELDLCEDCIEEMMDEAT